MDTPDDPNDYLNENLFHSIISKHLVTTPFTITKFENTSAVGVGENFISKILKNSITIELFDGTSQQLSFISKIIGSILIDDNSINEMKVFPKEMEMYQTVVPAFEKIWKEIGGIDIIFGPKLYYAEMEPHKILIFEDLNQSDYKMLNRLDGLNEQQVLVVLEKLAKWHAASNIYIEQTEMLNPIFAKGMFHSGFVGFLEGYYQLLYDSLLDSIDGCCDIEAEYLDIVKSWGQKIIPNLTKLTTYDPTEYNVLNHGDLWINNIMLVTNNTGVATDVKFVDYQLGIYASPAIDILYFLAMSVHYELFTSKFDDFVAYYHRELVSSLKQLKYDKIPTLKDLHEALLKNSFYGAMLIIEGVPTIMVDHKTDGIDIKLNGLDSEIGAANRKKFYNLSRTKAAIRGFIRFFGQRGMLSL